MKLAFFDTKSYDIPGFDRYGWDKLLNMNSMEEEIHGKN